MSYIDSVRHYFKYGVGYCRIGILACLNNNNTNTYRQGMNAITEYKNNYICTDI